MGIYVYTLRAKPIQTVHGETIGRFGYAFKESWASRYDGWYKRMESRFTRQADEARDKLAGVKLYITGDNFEDGAVVWEHPSDDLSIFSDGNSIGKVIGTLRKLPGKNKWTIAA